MLLQLNRKGKYKGGNDLRFGEVDGMKSPAVFPVDGTLTVLSYSVESGVLATTDFFKNGVFWFDVDFGVGTGVIALDLPFVAGDSFYAEHSGGDELKEVTVALYADEGFIKDAPIDGNAYGRQDGAWVEVYARPDPGVFLEIGDSVIFTLPLGSVLAGTILALPSADRDGYVINKQPENVEILVNDTFTSVLKRT